MPTSRRRNTTVSTNSPPPNRRAAIDELLYGVVPDHPAVVYLFPTVLLGAGLAVVADPLPTTGVVVGLLLSVAPSVAYGHTGLQQESTGSERSTADWLVIGAFLLVVGVVVAGETNAVSVSVIELLGAVTGLLAGAWVVEWLLPALRTRLDER
ncbi:hypothetical protein [Halolamina sediminis]|uniref:hypothetical protein n=1 Tax=Halolamina sediminis TaxID=1480675 RepID=UPI0006B5FE3D|nr:hypothetical protein [Halolamina sediminis]